MWLKHLLTCPIIIVYEARMPYNDATKTKWSRYLEVALIPDAIVG